MYSKANKDLPKDIVKNSLSAKITMIIFWSLVIGAGIAMTILFRNTQENLMDQYESNADRLAFSVYQITHETGSTTLSNMEKPVRRLMESIGIAGLRISHGEEQLALGEINSDSTVSERTILISSGSERVPNENMVDIFVYHPNLTQAVSAIRKIYLMVMGISLLIFGLFMAWILRKILTHPFESMVATAHALSKGDREARFSQTKNDEFGYLSKFFNHTLNKLVSQHKELQQSKESLKRTNDDLEERVQERTTELAMSNVLLNQEIEERKSAQIEAESANLAKSLFLANMSHELRTPLNAIIGFSEVLIDMHFGKLNETQKEYINDILESGRDLLSLIQEILDLSKIESGKMELIISAVNIPELLQRSLKMVKQKALKHDIEISIEDTDVLETISADERKINQVVYNLLSNAVKFTPDGGKIQIVAELVNGQWLRDHVPVEFNKEISIAVDNNCNGYLMVYVADSGKGIKSEALKEIFEPFHQEDTSASREYEGTGLGLALTKKILELHKGFIWVESEVGKGSCFTFALQMLKESCLKSAESSDSSSKPVLL